MRDARIFRVLCTLFLLVGLLAAPAAGVTADGGPITYEGNLRCEAFDLVQVYRAESPTTGVDPSGRVGWVVHDGENGELVDWTSTVPIAAVLVKGGKTGGNMYAYTGVFGGAGLQAPEHRSGVSADIRGVTFCAAPEPEPAPVAEPAPEPEPAPQPAPAPAPAPEPEPAPAPAPEVAPVPVPAPAPAPAPEPISTEPGAPAEGRGAPPPPEPVVGEGSSVSWDFARGLEVKPGTDVEIARLTVPDPAGAACTVNVETINGSSVHMGHNVGVYLNGELVVTLQGIEDEPYKATAGSAEFLSSGSDQLVVFLEPTLAHIASMVGSLTVTCIAQGEIVVEKITNPSDATQTFGFETTVEGWAPVLGNGESSAAVVAPGEYSITESAVPEWDLQDLTCDAPDAHIDLSARSATVNVGSGETVTCVFTNALDVVEPGTIVIEKVTEPSDATQTFAFETTVAGWAPVLGNGESSEIEVEPGEYAITETAVPEWYLSDLTCDDPDAMLDLQGTAVVEVAAGETVTCTFTNTQQGTLWVGKSTPGFEGEVYFEFTSDVAGWPPDLHGGMSATTTVEPGTYTVAELEKEGWELTDLTCDVPNAVIDLTTASATVYVGPGELVKCTFTNGEMRKPGAIGDYVWHDKDRDGVQETGEPGIEGVLVNLYAAGNPPVAQGAVLLATARTDPGGYYLIENVPAGDYIVGFSNLPEGYRFTKPFAANDKYLDSDAQVATGMTPVMVLPAGFVDLTCDAGAYLVLQEVLPLTGTALDWGATAGLTLVMIGAALVLGVKPRRGIE